MQAAAEAARLTQCTNNLRQIGIASHNFHRAFRFFQSDNSATAPPYPYPNTCWNLQTLSYIEDGTLVLKVVAGNGGTVNPGGNASGGGSLVPVNNGNVPISLYLCPSRGAPRADGLSDYGYLQQNGAVLYNFPIGASLPLISNPNGSSKTVMVAHLGCNPQDYPIGPTPWYNCLQPFSPTSMLDGEVVVGQYCTTLSSPHPAGNPALFCDGHIQTLDNVWLTNNSGVWYWRNTTAITLP